MVKYTIDGGKPLHGDVTISGAKNAAVGILAATGNATLLTLCAATSCSELAILLFRIGALYKNRRLLRENGY